MGAVPPSGSGPDWFGLSCSLSIGHCELPWVVNLTEIWNHSIDVKEDIL